MICDECKVAANFNTQGNLDRSKELHKMCKGDCGCHHKTGPGWFVKPGGKASLIQVQSP